MKKILLLAATVIAAVAVQAQSVCFVQDGEVLQDGATVLLTEVDPSGSMILWEPIIRNTSDDVVSFIISMNVIEKKYTEDMVSMCNAQNCFPEQVTELPAITLDAGAETTHSDFHGQFTLLAAMMSGKTDSYAKVEYTITDADSDEKIVAVIVEYDMAKASVEGALVASEAKLFQNGGNLMCRYNFDSAANRSVVVSSIVGATVANVPLNGNNGEVVLNRLPKGVYVYTLVEDGRNVKSRKIVVR